MCHKGDYDCAATTIESRTDLIAMQSINDDTAQELQVVALPLPLSLSLSPFLSLFTCLLSVVPYKQTSISINN